jgi:N-acetylglucosaminyldiphosphoundecaprenol N-acetyl-beta-D-mannosaminyltransferase
MNPMRTPLGPVAIDVIERGPALAEIERFIARRTPSHIITLNSLMFNAALRDTELARIVSRAALILPDSVGIVWATRHLAGKSVGRITGIDLIDDIASTAQRKGYRLYLLGAAPAIAEQAARALQARFPGLAIAGTRHGYFSDAETPSVLCAIRESKADILLVGLAVPHQEKWIARYREETGIPVIIGVGGSFDVLAGKLQRAPRWMQSMGLEWLFRLLQQPWRIARMKDLPVFVWQIARLRRRGAAGTGQG